ncbi:unnamed protein product [Oppiella nova]|uniref:Uncharacterized protein n=1 Tax=Oppiella nova TaxID=334625 RepID=A0A7R9MMC6_9ACAR|nr:unnamed protein product [Oppiella nova]CAG2179831.1 unnamed protein product [Oppiella nova]
MWPTSMSNLCVICSAFFLLMVCEPSVTQLLTDRLWRFGFQIYIISSLPLMLRAVIISCVFGISFILVALILRQYFIRLLLSYRGWMNEISSRGKSKKVMLWAIALRLVSGYQPSLYSFQRSLPRMPVPSLRHTIHKLFESLKPVCSEEELVVLKKQSKVS